MENIQKILDILYSEDKHQDYLKYVSSSKLEELKDYAKFARFRQKLRKHHAENDKEKCLKYLSKIREMIVKYTVIFDLEFDEMHTLNDAIDQLTPSPQSS